MYIADVFFKPISGYLSERYTHLCIYQPHFTSVLHCIIIFWFHEWLQTSAFYFYFRIFGFKNA